MEPDKALVSEIFQKFYPAPGSTVEVQLDSPVKTNITDLLREWVYFSFLYFRENKKFGKGGFNKTLQVSLTFDAWSS